MTPAARDWLKEYSLPVTWEKTPAGGPGRLAAVMDPSRPELRLMRTMLDRGGRLTRGGKLLHQRRLQRVAVGQRQEETVALLPALEIVEHLQPQVSDHRGAGDHQVELLEPVVGLTVPAPLDRLAHPLQQNPHVVTLLGDQTVQYPLTVLGPPLAPGQVVLEQEVEGDRLGAAEVLLGVAEVDLGIGAGAHGKLSFPHRVLRQVRWREPAAYMKNALLGQAVSNEHEVARRDLPFEFMLNALRLREGFDLARFAERTGLPLSAVQAPLALAEGRGLIERDAAGTLVRPTARGFDFLSDLQSLFLPPAAKDRGRTMAVGAFPAAVRPLVP